MEEQIAPAGTVPATYLARLAVQARYADAYIPMFAVDSAAPDEVRELAEALNDMVARMRQERVNLAAAKAALERATDQAEAASRAKTAFLANLSHELRSPLNSILGFTEMLASGIYGPISEEQQSRLARILANGHALLALLNEVLDLARIEAGKLQMQWIDIDLAVILRTVVASIEPEVKRKALDLQVEIEPDLGRVRTDVDRLRQILGNLLNNAIKFTSTGAITVSGRLHPERPDWVRLTVADTGMGIPADALARIWEEFYQVDPSRRRKGGGAGLGLPITRKLVELLGGTIAVESAEDAGTCFYVDLPCGL